eukprot:GILI01028463.1.p1 GENE.GILI01028463.1~~GILI01028463.1.p1  ORF type:complete len:486 (+),score=45.08 GILI01028463.1:50-1507(+)
MPLTRRTGTTVGYGCVGAAVAFAAVAIANKRSSDSTLFLSSIASAMAAVSMGCWLLNRLYLSDPDARREYVRDITGSPLSASLAKYSSIDSLLFVLSPQSPAEQVTSVGDPNAFLLQMVYDDLGVAGGLDLRHRRLSYLTAKYTGSNLRDFLSHHMITKDQLRAMFLADCAACSTFSELSSSFSKNSLSSIAGCVGSDVMDRSSVQALVDAEFPWVRQPGASAGSGQDVIGAILSHHQALLGDFNYKIAELTNIIEMCPQMQVTSFLECLEAGLGQLAEKGITTHNWRAQMLARTPPTEETLWEFDAGVGVRYLLGFHDRRSPSSGDLHTYGPVQLLESPKAITGSSRIIKGGSRILDPKDLQKMFARALPAGAHFGATNAGGCPKTNLVSFLIYWEDVLLSCPEVVSPSIATPLQAAYREYTIESKHIKSLIEKAATKHQKVPKEHRNEAESRFIEACWQIHCKYASSLMASNKSDLNLTCNQQ